MIRQLTVLVTYVSLIGSVLVSSSAASPYSDYVISQTGPVIY